MPAAEPGFALALVRRAGDALCRVPRVLSLVAPVAWGGLIWWLSSRSLPRGDPSLFFATVGNLAHAPLFGILALLLLPTLPRDGASGWPRFTRARVFGVILAVGAYALVDELHQGASPGREVSVFDVVTDLVGAGCVLAVAAHAHDRDAREGGVRARLALGVALCVAAAVAASVAS